MIHFVVKIFIIWDGTVVWLILKIQLHTMVQQYSICGYNNFY